MAFQTIHTAPGLDDQRRARAHRSGPWAVASTYAPADLVIRAGFTNVVVVDQTIEFGDVAEDWITQWDHHRAELVALYGEAEFETRQQERRTQLDAINDGLLQRSLVAARLPGA